MLDRVARPDLGGFWIHVDCDVLNPDVMPATGALEPGGPTGEELGTFLNPLATHPKALGLALTQYDPSLDHRRCEREASRRASRGSHTARSTALQANRVSILACAGRLRCDS